MNGHMMMDDCMIGTMLGGVLLAVAVAAALVLLMVQTIYQGKILGELRQVNQKQSQVDSPGAGDSGGAS